MELVGLRQMTIAYTQELHCIPILRFLKWFIVRDISAGFVVRDIDAHEGRDTWHDDTERAT